MKKTFSIEMSKQCWCAKNIENCLQIHHKGTVRVTELPTNHIPIEKLSLKSKEYELYEKINEIIDHINKESDGKGN